ncbi:hypothetical protein H8E07_10090 [bacterium]|nr:hypothetical protein [bacterium]
MINWTSTDLVSALLVALSAEHGSCGSDETNCTVCMQIADARLWLVTRDDYRPGLVTQRPQPSPESDDEERRRIR